MNTDKESKQENFLIHVKSESQKNKNTFVIQFQSACAQNGYGCLQNLGVNIFVNGFKNSVTCIFLATLALKKFPPKGVVQNILSFDVFLMVR